MTPPDLRPVAPDYVLQRDLLSMFRTAALEHLATTTCTEHGVELGESVAVANRALAMWKDGQW